MSSESSSLMRGCQTMTPFQNKRIILVAFILGAAVLAVTHFNLKEVWPRNEFLPRSEVPPSIEGLPNKGDLPSNGVLPSKGVLARNEGLPGNGDLQRNGVLPRTEALPKNEVLPSNGVLPNKDAPPASSGVRRVNRGIAHYNAEFYARLRALTSRNATARDPDLVALVRDVIDGPSNHNLLKLARKVVRTPQVDEVEKILKNAQNKFYVECGALDGERSSNTLFLEQERGWKGLLVEVDPYFYTQLLGRSRHAWSINACLSPYDFAIELPFHGHAGGEGRIDLQANNTIDVITVPCFPFETIMLALNQSHVDYFSLDVEGVELNILKTIPFNHITVDVMSVEYAHGKEGKQVMKDYMEQQGFSVHKDIRVFNSVIYFSAEDFIFVHKSVH